MKSLSVYLSRDDEFNQKRRKVRLASTGSPPHPLPRISVDRWLQVAETARTETTPVVIAGVFSESTAVKTWTPQSLANRFGDLHVGVAVDLPEHTAPYLDDYSSHGKSMTVSELVLRLQAGERCYLNQASLDRFANLGQEIDLSTITIPPVYSVNLWLGGRTRSGLHFDSADNFLVQVFGQKRAVLVAPTFARFLRLLPDTPSKSRLSPDEIESEVAFPAVPRWSAVIMPGDALFIPRGWWHYLASFDCSISVNVWHGDRLDFKDRCAAFFRSGPAVWARVARDFVWCGLLHRPYRQRLFSPPALGLDFYRRLAHRR